MVYFGLEFEVKVHGSQGMKQKARDSYHVATTVRKQKVVDVLCFVHLLLFIQSGIPGH